MHHHFSVYANHNQQGNFKMPIIRAFFLISVATLFGSTALADTYETTVEPGVVYNMAAFKLWHSPDVKNIRGILMLNPGSNGDGRGMVDDSYWQDFAVQHDLALMGTYFTDHRHVNMMIEHYIKVNEGSGQALIDAIDQFAKDSGHQELSYAPFLLWGHSAGGELNHEIAAWIPERVIAYVVNQGGYYYSSVPPEATRKTPGLYFVGLSDLVSRNTIIKGIFTTNRRAGALWTYVEEKGVGHEVVGSRDLALVFYEEVMSKRLPNDAMGYKALLPVTEEMGIRGNIISHEIVAADDNEVKREETSWLISERLADAWQELVSGDSAL